jgi:putative transposase
MYTASEKLAIIRLVEESELSIRRTLREIKVSRTSFYRWYRAYEERGLDGLENRSRAARQHWNRIPDSVRELIVEVALKRPDLTPGSWPGISPIPMTILSRNPVFIAFSRHMT